MMEGFDFNSLLVGGVALAVMVGGLTQFFKTLFKLDGNQVLVLAFFLGALVIGANEAMVYLPEVYGQVFQSVLKVLVGALTAAGYYKYGTRNDDVTYAAVEAQMNKPETPEDYFKAG